MTQRYTLAQLQQMIDGKPPGAIDPPSQRLWVDEQWRRALAYHEMMWDKLDVRKKRRYLISERHHTAQHFDPEQEPLYLRSDSIMFMTVKDVWRALTLFVLGELTCRPGYNLTEFTYNQNVVLRGVNANGSKIFYHPYQFGGYSDWDEQWGHLPTCRRILEDY